MTPDVDLESAAYVLYVAQREVDSIPYTAPEALASRMRQVVPLAQELVDEIRRLREAGTVGNGWYRSKDDDYSMYYREAGT